VAINRKRNAEEEICSFAPFYNQNKINVKKARPKTSMTHFRSPFGHQNNKMFFGAPFFQKGALNS
jgi:hypothetical protein